jgi:hypothetical protein
MHRRSLITTGLGALASTTLPGLARAQSKVEQEQLPPPQPIDTSHPDDDGYNSPPPPQRQAPRDQGDNGYRDQGQDSYQDRPADGAAGRPEQPDPKFSARPSYPANTRAQTYSRDEIVNSASNFFGVTTEAVAGVIEKVFKDNGRPTGYIAGEEGSAAFIAGLRYGHGLLYMKGRERMQVHWQGPSVGFDWGGNASRVFTLCYNLQYPDMIFRRFPGVDGSAYLIGGLGVNYQRADDITLAPIRTGLGLRLGANLGYLSYSRKRRFSPF